MGVDSEPMAKARLFNSVIVVFIATLFSGMPVCAGQERFYGFEHFNNEKTLTSQSIVSAAQDKNGFLWFGSEDNGAFRYDGSVFKPYKHNNSDEHSIAPGRIYAILSDSQGFVWFATVGAGVSQYNPDTDQFKTFRHNPDDEASLGSDVVRSLMEDQAGNIWLGTNKDISIYNPSSQNFSHIEVGPGALSGADIWHLFQGADKTIWIATYGDGLNEYNPHTKTFRYYRHDPNDPTSIAHDIVGGIVEDANGNIWVGGKGGLNRLNRDTGTFTRFQHEANNKYSLLDNYVWDLHLDKRGFLWVAGFGGGLGRFDLNTGKVIRHVHDAAKPHSLSSNLVFFVFEDNGGVLWAGTSNSGLNKYSLAKDRFAVYLNSPAIKNAFPLTNLVSVYETRDNLLWLAGTDPKGGIVSWDIARDLLHHYKYHENDLKGVPNGAIYAFAEDQQGYLWFTGGVTGLKRLDRNTGVIQRFQHEENNPNSLIYDGTTALMIDGEDSLWICTHDGVSKLDASRTQFTHYIAGKQCDAIMMDKPGNIWIGSASDGVYLLKKDQDNLINYRHIKGDEQSLSANYVTNIYQADNGQIWLGTLGAGINLWVPEKESFERFSEMEGLASNSVSAMVGDDLGRLWIATANGLSVFEPSTRHFINFYVEDGLLSNSFDNISDSLSMRSENGYLYFANGNGLLKIKPDSVLTQTSVPNVVITNIQKSHKEVALPTSPWALKKLSLDWKDSMVSFSFSVLDFSNPEKNEAYYKLEGFDEDWIAAGQSNRAVYTNLDGGQYVFKVKALNSHGVLTEKPVELELKVMLPWWESDFAILCYLVFFISGAWIFINLKVRAKETELVAAEKLRKELETQVNDRTEHLNQAIDDLNANKEFMVQAEKMLSMGRLVTGVAHEINTPLGVGITSSSALHEEVNTLKTKMKDNSLARHDFENTLENMFNLSTLLGQSLKNAAQLINQFKKLSIEEVSEKNQACSIIEYIESMKKTVSQEFSTQKIQWHIQCNESLVINSSPYAIYTILENLATNCVKHAYPLGQTCEINIAVKYDEENKELQIKVSDQGVGISEENQLKIFDPFFTSAREQNCTGLGLHIVYNEIIHRLQGKIQCHSVQGQGTDFSMSFPAEVLTKS